MMKESTEQRRAARCRLPAQALLLSHPARDTRDLALYAPLQRCGQSGSGNGFARKGLRVLAAEVRAPPP